MYPLIAKKAVMEYDLAYEEKLIDEMCQFDTRERPFIKREKFRFESAGDLIIITYKIYQTECQINHKVSCFKEHGYNISTTYFGEVNI